MSALAPSEVLPPSATPSDVMRYARRANDRQFKGYCEACRKLLLGKDRAKAGAVALQQLLLIVTVSPWLQLSEDLCRLLYAIMAEPQQGPWRLRILCSRLLQHALLAEPKSLSAPLERRSIPLAVHVLQSRGSARSLLPSHMPTMIKWLQEDKELFLTSLPFLISINTHLQSYVESVHVQQVATAMARAMTQAPIHQPSSGKSKVGAPYEEPDGSPSPPPFTALCIGKAYGVDHLRAIQAFSGVRSWCRRYSHQVSDGENDDDDRLVLAPSVQDTYVAQCTRVLEQSMVNTSEKASRRELDELVTQAAAVEAIGTLKELCYNDTSILTHLMPVLKRMLTHATKDGAPKASIHAALIDFFAHHGRIAVYDSTEALKSYFGPLLAQYYWYQPIAYATVELMTEHLDYLRRHNVMIGYLPNILKLIAWHPRLFLQEYLNILPALISPLTCVEVFHCILDLPCMTAALQLRRVKTLEQLVAESDQPYISKALYNYITRSEGGLGGTIDRLGEMHQLLASQKEGLRVQSAAEIVPLLLRGYFDVMLKDADNDSLKELVPVILERVAVLYDIRQMREDVQAVLADVILSIFSMQPSLVIDLKQELMEFINNRSNVAGGREEFFLHIVWIIGEYTSPQLDERCDTKVMVVFHEALESFSYEVRMTLQSNQNDVVNPAYQAIHTTRLMNVLMTALAKIATRCPEVLPRVRLDLVKIIQQHSANKTMSASDKQLVLDRARLLANTLQQPAVAAAVLNGSVVTQNSDRAVALTQHVDVTGTLAMLEAFRFAQGSRKSLEEPKIKRTEQDGQGLSAVSDLT